MTTSQQGWIPTLEEMGLEMLELLLSQKIRYASTSSVPVEAQKELWEFIIERYKKGCEVLEGQETKV